MTGFAQKAERIQTINYLPRVANSYATTAQRGTGISDTTILLNNYTQELFDTSAASYIDRVAPTDSGYAFGTNALGTKGYAELFEFGYGGDTTINLIGVVSLWHGRYSATTTKTIDWSVWRQGATTQVATNRKLTGAPSTLVTSNTVSIKNLGIGNGAGDSIKSYYFQTPTNGINYSFYLGYTLNYNWASLGGDSITLRTTRGGYGLGIGEYSIAGNDTTIYARNAIQNNAGTWQDAYYYYGYARNLSVVPLIRFSGSRVGVGIAGIKKNNLTFYGCYPNPAVNTANVKIALAKNTTVTIQIIDMAGRVLNTETAANLGQGEHVISVPVAALPAGMYTYLVRTAEGDAMASQLTITK